MAVGTEDLPSRCLSLLEEVKGLLAGPHQQRSHRAIFQLKTREHMTFCLASTSAECVIRCPQKIALQNAVYKPLLLLLLLLLYCLLSSCQKISSSPKSSTPK